MKALLALLIFALPAGASAVESVEYAVISGADQRVYLDSIIKPADQRGQ